CEPAVPGLAAYPIRVRASSPPACGARMDPSRSWKLVWLGLALTAAVAVPPIFLEPLPVTLRGPWPEPLLAWGARGPVILGMGAAVAACAWGRRRSEPWTVALILGLAAAAGLMTACHYVRVDVPNRDWQLDLYLKILNHEHLPPHHFRPLPYGFVRSL